MEKTEYALARPVSLSLPLDELDKLLREKDGGCALVYLALQRGGSRPLSPADVGMTAAELRSAMEKLRALGLVETCRAVPLPPADELPQYTAHDMLCRSREDTAFRGALLHAEQLYGRRLTTPETRSLLGMYDYLGFPAEVLMELLTYVFEACRADCGDGRAPTIRMIEKEAYRWAQDEVLTPAQAEAYIRRRHERREQSAKLLQALQIHGRAPTPSERKYLESWLDMGFGEDAVAEAYDRTVLSTGSLKWPYLNKILQSWHRQGLRTAEEIAAGDPRGSGRQKRAVRSTDAPRNDLARGEALLRDMTQKHTKE